MGDERDTKSNMPWNTLMAFGFGKLGLSSREFWSLTPREINAALTWHLGMISQASAIRTEDLETLMGRYPDKDNE
ncbi:MAG: phage tail assembly chaperone [Pseudomonadota bacterium]